MNTNIIDKYPEIKFVRYDYRTLYTGRNVKVNRFWAFTPYLAIITGLLIEQVLRSFGIYKSSMFNIILFTLLIGGVLVVILAYKNGYSELKKITMELEHQVDYIENIPVQFKRIVKDGRFGIYDNVTQQIVVVPKYDYIGAFIKGRAMAKVGTVEVCIDGKTGKELI